MSPTGTPTAVNNSTQTTDVRLDMHIIVSAKGARWGWPKLPRRVVPRMHGAVLRTVRVAHMCSTIPPAVAVGAAFAH